MRRRCLGPRVKRGRGVFPAERGAMSDQAPTQPAPLVTATQNGQYVQEGAALLAACPGVRGSGLLGN
jgi:hypothetical protein